MAALPYSVLVLTGDSGSRAVWEGCSAETSEHSRVLVPRRRCLGFELCLRHHRKMATKHSPASGEVGRRIVWFRRRAGVSARALAACADMDLTNYQRIERGRGNPTLSTLLQIATALEVDLSALVTGLRPEELQNGRLPYGYTDIPRRRRGPNSTY